MKFTLAFTSLVACASAAVIGERANDPWQFTNFQVKTAAGTSTVSFDLTATYPPVTGLHCSASTPANQDIVRAYCAGHENYNFNLTSGPDGGKAFVLEWRFTGHGGYVGSYAIAPAQFAAGTYTGPANFAVTDFHSTYY